MSALVKRNLLRYFQSKSNVFWSIFSPLLILGLYEIFLKHNLSINFKDQMVLLNQWLLGGALSVTTLTTSFNILKTKVTDELGGQKANLLVNGLSMRQIMGSYLTASGIVGFIMTTIIYFIYVIFFELQGEFFINFEQLGNVVSMILLNTLISVAINGAIVTFIHDESALQGVGTALNTMSGFLVGAYVPIGIVPTGAQHLMQGWPGFLTASVFRNQLITTPLTLSEKKYLGTIINWGNHQLTHVEIYLILISVSVILIIITMLGSRE